MYDIVGSPYLDDWSSRWMYYYPFLPPPFLRKPCRKFRRVISKPCDTEASRYPLRRACMNQDKSSEVEIPQYPHIFWLEIAVFKKKRKNLFRLHPQRLWAYPFSPVLWVGGLAAYSKSKFLFFSRFYLHIDSIVSRTDFEFGFTIPI